MLGKDIDIRDDLVYQRAAAGRDLLCCEQERLRAVQQISYESSVEAVGASTHTEEPVKLVEQLPLLVVEHESTEADTVATVELCLVTELSENVAHFQRAGQDFRHCLPGVFSLPSANGP